MIKLDECSKSAERVVIVDTIQAQKAPFATGFKNGHVCIQNHTTLSGVLIRLTLLWLKSMVEVIRICQKSTVQISSL